MTNGRMSWGIRAVIRILSSNYSPNSTYSTLLMEKGDKTIVI
jgi:hypothetical protein